MIPIIAFVLILGILVFVHELGHFIVAKRTGIVVEEFAFGYPPRLFRLWQNEGKITLDGKSMVIGNKTQVPRQVEVRQRVVYQSETGKDGRQLVTQLVPVPEELSDEEASAEYGRAPTVVQSLERGTEYSVNMIPFGGYVRMLGEEDPSAPGSFASKSKKVRLAVLVAGAGMNLVLAVLVFASTFMLGAPEPVATDNVMIMGVSAGSPAAAADIRVGDMVASIDGVAVSSTDQLVELIHQRAGQEIQFVVKRGQEIVELSIVPRADPPPGEGSLGIMIQPAVSKVEVVYYPPLQALWLGLKQTFNMVAFTLSVPLLILRGLMPAEAVRPIGPYGIYQQTASAVKATVQMGWWYPILSLVGLISTALAITNLLPLPALDGGRIVFILIEAVRGRRVDPAREGFVHFVGMAVLLALMLVVSYFDIIRPVTAIDWTSLF